MNGSSTKSTAVVVADVAALVGVFDKGTILGVTDSVGASAGDAVRTLEFVVVVALEAPSRIGSGDVPIPRPAVIGEAAAAPRPAIGDGDRTDDEPNTDEEVTEDCSTVEGDGAAGLRFYVLCVM